MLVLTFAFLPVSKDCEENYAHFLEKYGKTRSDAARERFCTNLEWLVSRGEKCPHCMVTSVYDEEFSSLVGHIPLLKKPVSNAHYTCEEVYCFAKDPLPKLTVGPESIDLRELGLVTLSSNEQECGSCWGFAAVGALENSLLLDEKLQNRSAWALDARTLDASEQFFLGNTRGFSQYCTGGDSVTALNYMIDNPELMKTVEFNSNFPYDFKNGEEEWKNSKDPIPPKIGSESYVYPFRVFDRVQNPQISGTEKTPVVSLMNDYEFDGIKVEAYLSRGIAVIASMYTQETKNSANELASYNGKGVLKNYYCSNTSRSDHEVLFIGYGEKDDEKVWVVRNSWGADWGSEGSFYIRMGANELCIENYAYAIIPETYEPEAVFKNQGYNTPFDIVRDKNGLDDDDGEFDEFEFPHITPSDGLGTVEILLIVIGCIVAVALLAWLTQFLVKKCKTSNVNGRAAYKDIVSGPVEDY